MLHWYREKLQDNSYISIEYIVSVCNDQGYVMIGNLFFGCYCKATGTAYPSRAPGMNLGLLVTMMLIFLAFCVVISTTIFTYKWCLVRFYIQFFWYSDVQHILCYFFSSCVLSIQCCQFLWIVHSWLPLRLSLTPMHLEMFCVYNTKLHVVITSRLMFNLEVWQLYFQDKWLYSTHFSCFWQHSFGKRISGRTA